MREKLFVAGHRGLVGSAVCRRLADDSSFELVTRPKEELDLTEQHAVDGFFDEVRPGAVVLAAAKVGGIAANAARPAEFARENLAIQSNVLHAAWRTGVRRLIFFGSSCIYPRLCPQPIREESLLTGPLEETNRAYAVAKIAGVETCSAYNRQYGTCFVTLMPANLYGPGDNFDLESSHVVPALMRKFVEAKAKGASSVQVWGTGRPRRELLHVDDLARACTMLLSHDSPPEILNVGTGEDITIKELAELIGEVVGFSGKIEFDPSRPDGTPRKVLDTSRISALGWGPEIALRDGLAEAVRWFEAEVATGVHRQALHSR